MKCVLVLSVFLAAAYSLVCKKGDNVKVDTGLTDETCESSETKCFKPVAKDDNTFMKYGCGACPADKTADCVDTCTADKCNTFVAPTYGNFKCYNKNTDSDTDTDACTGATTKTCYYVKKGYAGDHAKLKGKYGGCGGCDQFTDDDDVKGCEACGTAGDKCNKVPKCDVPTVANGTVAGKTAIGDGKNFTLTCKDKFTLTAKVKDGNKSGVFNCTVDGATATLTGKDAFVCNGGVRIGSVMGLLATLVYLLLH